MCEKCDKKREKSDGKRDIIYSNFTPSTGAKYAKDNTGDYKNA